MAVALSTNQAVFDNMSLVKIETRYTLDLFRRFYCSLLESDFNLENKA